MRPRQTPESTSLFQRVIASKLFYPVVGAMFAVVAFGVVREAIRQYQLNQDIGKLEQEIASLESRNQDLNQLIRYLHTDSYKERRARESLGLARPDENVVVVPDRVTENTDETSQEVKGESTEQLSNVDRWIRYFFKT